MIYLSVDTETSGLNFDSNQMLSIGVIVEDTTKKLPFKEIPKFHCAIVRDNIIGELFALNLNRDLIQTINDWNTSDVEGKTKIESETGMIFCREEDVVKHLFRFLFLNNVLDKSLYDFSLDRRIEVYEGVTFPSISSTTPISHLNIAGKNFATFDKIFIEKLPRWKQLFKIRQRIIDPTVFFTDWDVDDSLPSLTKCKERAGLDGNVSHNAIEDAWDVIELLRKKY